MEFYFSSSSKRDLCGLCGGRRVEIKEETGTPINSSEDKTVGQFCRELELFWSNYYGGGARDSFRQLEGLEVCGECRPLISGALRRKDNIVRMAAGVRKLEEKLRKERNELKRHLNQFLKEMRKIKEVIGGEAPEGYQEDGGDLQAVIQQVLHHIKKEENIPSPKSSNETNVTPVEHLPKIELDDADAVKVEVTFEPDHEDDPDWHPATADQEDPEEEMDWEPESGSEPDNSQDNYFEDEDSSEDFKPMGDKVPKKTAVKQDYFNEGSASSSDDDDNDLSGMSKFKKLLIKRAQVRPALMAKRKAQHVKMRKADKFSIEDPSENLSYCLEYSSERDCLLIKDIRITIHENPPGLECSACSYRVPRYPDKERYMDHRMTEHVTSKHLHVFQCPHCGKDNANYTKYRYHVASHRKLIKCDICEKPLSSKTLRCHRWTHMSAEERAEAERNGVKDPRWRPPLSEEPTFQCATCGKGFIRKGQLKAHETIHNKKFVICPTCGKEFWEKTYKYGHRQTCEQSLADPDRPPIQCPKCPKTFTTPGRLKGHIKYNHLEDSQEKKFLCELCSRAFKSSSLLKKHMDSVHSEARPYSCSKGCGMTFKVRNCWSRHLKKCEGHGTKPGRNKGAPWKKQK